jgi:hypothetical protein
MVLNKVKEKYKLKKKNLLLNEWTQYEFKMPNFSLLALPTNAKILCLDSLESIVA